MPIARSLWSARDMTAPMTASTKWKTSTPYKRNESVHPDIACTLDGRGSIQLDTTDCIELLQQTALERGVGRLAVVIRDEIHIVPVNFSIAGDELLVRLGPGTAASHLDGAAIVFEVDHEDSYARRGWSVVVHGTARGLSFEEEVRMGRNLPDPIVTVPGIRVFALQIIDISGRVVLPESHFQCPLE
jgi:uncharacterized protein